MHRLEPQAERHMRRLKHGADRHAERPPALVALVDAYPGALTSQLADPLDAAAMGAYRTGRPAGRFSPLGPLGTASDPWMVGERGAWTAISMPHDTALLYQTPTSRIDPLLIGMIAKKFSGNLGLSQPRSAKYKQFNIIGEWHIPL